MPTTKIYLLTITPIGILVVFCDRLWQFRVLSSDGIMYGHTKSYYSADTTEKAGREWVEPG